MSRADFAALPTTLRAAASLVIVALGLVGIVGSGGGIAFLPSDCPPGMNCNSVVTPMPLVQPARVTAQVGTSVTFTLTGLNVPASQATYQWARSSNAGAHYVDIAGATGDTLVLDTVNLADDGSTFRLTVSANGVSGSAITHLAVSASPGLVYADGEFALEQWLAAPFAAASAPPPSHSEERVATGGRPGAYRTMVFQLAPEAAFGGVAYTWVADAYDPAMQGAVSSIDYSEDGISLDTRSAVATQTAMLLEQAGRKYVATSPDALARLAMAWQVSQNTPALRARDFTLLDGPPCHAGESCPDFSSGGAPMRFGYWRLSAGPRGASIAHAIDNWKVTVWRR